jgi:predicted nucleic acid-binding protein
MPVLDTSFLVDLQRGEARARAAADRLGTQVLLVPFQAALEFMSGFADPAQALHLLRSSFDVTLPTEAHLIAGASLRRDMRAQGRRPAWADLHIATEARLAATFVVTADAADFLALGCAVWDYRNEAKPPEQ